MYNILVQNSEYNILYILVPVSCYGVESAHIMKGELSVHCKSLIVHTARKTIYSMMRSCKDTSNCTDLDDDTCTLQCTQRMYCTVYNEYGKT